MAAFIHGLVDKAHHLAENHGRITRFCLTFGLKMTTEKSQWDSLKTMMYLATEQEKKIADGAEMIKDDIRKNCRRCRW